MVVRALPQEHIYISKVGKYVINTAGSGWGKTHGLGEKIVVDNAYVEHENEETTSTRVEFEWQLW